MNLSAAEIESFHDQGYVVVPGLLSPEQIADMREVADDHVASQLAPVEYEVDVQYPGSPASMTDEGGETSRRLLHAYSRHELYREWATAPQIATVLRQLFGSDDIELSQCHHNCVMTKHPGFSSATLWHQDNRYWSFDEQNLISVWTALGEESSSNGCLRVIPGSHHLNLDPGAFDAALFLRPDLEQNKKLIQQSIKVELAPGDVLFFHSKLFHAAGRNRSNEVKYSLVFTYHESRNRPIQNTRSARFPGITL